jgi:hypothetical protein
MANIEQKLVYATAGNPIVVGDRVVIATQWLKACAFMEFDGKPVTVTNVRDFGFRGRCYTVKLTDSREWQVFSWRGVFKVVPE